MKTFTSFLKSILSACPYSMVGKKCARIIKGEKHARPQQNNNILKYRNSIKTGRNIALMGVFCPFLWYAILSGKSYDFILLNMVHSGIIAGIGLFLMLISRLALANYRKTMKN